MLGLSYPGFQTASGLQRGLGLKITAMASENEQKNPRILCFHGFRTSGRILHSVIGKWPDSILRTLDLDFLDGPFPATGKSDVDRLFDPPYYEWYQASKVRLQTKNIIKNLNFLKFDVNDDHLSKVWIFFALLRL